MVGRWVAAISTPFLPLWVSYGFQPVSKTPLASIRVPDAIFQASATHLHAVTVMGVQIATATAKVSIGRMVFSSLNTPSRFLSEKNSPI